MAFQFPASPAVNQTFTPVAGTTYRWSGTAWHLLAGPGSFITQAEGDARYLQQAGADALYVNVNEVPNIQNRIINGKFAIDQRNAGAEITIAGGTVVLDRWSAVVNAASLITMGRKVLTPGAYYLQTKCAVARPALSAGDEFVIRQTVEGVNVADLLYGTASARPFTIAFDIRASVAGTVSFSARGATTLQYYVVTVPVTTSFTTATVTVPGATTGTWEVGNGPGMYLDWSFAVGATATAPAASTAWAVGAFNNAPGATNFMTTAGTTLDLANVRLYKGAVDFGPDRRLYAEELALCQRYFQKIGFSSGARYYGARAETTSMTRWGKPLVVPMRGLPTMTLVGTEFRVNDGSSQAQALSIVEGGSTTESISLELTTAASLVALRPCFVTSLDTNSGIHVSAEL